MEITELKNQSLRWECEDCKRTGLWFGADRPQTPTNNGERHAERFGHTTFMTSMRWGFVDGKYITVEEGRI